MLPQPTAAHRRVFGRVAMDDLSNIWRHSLPCIPLPARVHPPMPLSLAHQRAITLGARGLFATVYEGLVASPLPTSPSLLSLVLSLPIFPTLGVTPAASPSPSPSFFLIVGKLVQDGLRRR
jgi:hypothetical protein